MRIARAGSPTPGNALRLLMAVTALGAAIWLGLSLASERLEAEVLTLVLSKERVPAAALDDALTKSRRARRLQPDASPLLLEWAALSRRGRPREAAPLLEELVAQEPENARAWLLLMRATPDPRRASEARRRFRALEPR